MLKRVIALMALAFTALLVAASAASAASPTLDFISPNQGSQSGGTAVVVGGSGFADATGVTFDGQPGTSFTVVADDVITVDTPPHAPGAATVVVEHPDGDADFPNGFTYQASAPTITAVAPDQGSAAGGNTVTIAGANFNSLTGVTFGGVSATITSATATEIEVIAPPHAAGVVNVAVSTLSGTSADTSADDYRYVAAPTINWILPDLGSISGGTPVIIQGTGFTDASTVTFGGEPASFVVDSNSQITATTPPHSVAGTVDVVVTTAGGSSVPTTHSEFTYYAVPTIASVTPNLGSVAGGSSVTITGTGFTGVDGVKFGDINAPDFMVVSDTQIDVTAPPSPMAGDVDISVSTQFATSLPGPTDVFTYREKKVKPDVPTPAPVVPAPPVTQSPPPVATLPPALPPALTPALPQVTITPTPRAAAEVPSRTGVVTVPNMAAVCPLGAGPCNASNVALNAVLPGKKGRVVTLGHDWFKVAAGETKGITAKLSNQGKRLLAKYKKLTVTVLVTVRNADTGAEAIQAKTITLKAPTVNKHNRKG